jgi:hypothetical protein
VIVIVDQDYTGPMMDQGFSQVHEQEVFGGHIVGGSTSDALTEYMAATNAAMTPLLDAPGIAALYSERATLVMPLDGQSETEIVGRDAIEAYFARLGEAMLSLTYIEHCRTIKGRHAVWEGTVKGVQAGTRHHLEIPAALSIQFDEADLVSSLRAIFNIAEAKRQLPDIDL